MSYEKALERARREYPHVQAEIQEMIAYQRFFHHTRRLGQTDNRTLALARLAVDKTP